MRHLNESMSWKVDLKNLSCSETRSSRVKWAICRIITSTSGKILARYFGSRYMSWYYISYLTSVVASNPP